MKRKQKKKTTVNMLKFPGIILQKHIQTNEPILSGYYVCFCPIINDALDCFPMAKPIITFWDNKQWIFQDVTEKVKKIILGWIGPLPNLSTDELQECEPNEAALTLFYIGTEEQGKDFKFRKGPFYRLIQASLTKGKKGECIFLVNSRKTIPVIISRFDEKKESGIKWVKDKKTEIKNKLFNMKNTKVPKKRKSIKMKR